MTERPAIMSLRYEQEAARLLTAAADGAITYDDAPLAPGHIAVLVRTHNEGAVIKQALLQATGPVLLPEFLPDSIHHRPETSQGRNSLATDRAFGEAAVA